MEQVCIVFNFNGVLVNTRSLAVQLFNQIAVTKGFRSIQPDQVEELSRLSIRNRCKLLGVPWHQMPIVGMLIKAGYQDAFPTMKAVEGISKLLHDLKARNIKIGFITSNSQKATREFLPNNRMDFFDYEYFSSNPFTKFRDLNQFCKKFNLKKEDLIYVGDELRDIKAANRLRIKSIGVTWGYDSSTLLQQGKPTFIAAKPGDILSFIKGE
ncbi:HAD hydrolase-like protein [Paenibacillus sp. 7124]|uniref:HAD hydrolase-like protein n=1 Tax=Paenibacillus apii TaxID=1850370 RepID=A0A6M1PHU0_9BACL|nr:HAD hydrolase-like protein [Paenibacillus apii]NGM82114.1 HAD hydrolase-like protein [Paenibacillus apii]